MAITPIDDRKIKFGATLATNFKRMIDIVRGQDFGAGFFHRFGHNLFEIGVMSKHESEADVHYIFGVEVSFPSPQLLSIQQGFLCGIW